MIQVRDIFQVKFGQIDQAVELFTSPEAPYILHMAPEHCFSVLTDVSGSMYTLVNEYLVSNFSEYETMLNESFAHPGFNQWFKQFQLFVEGGRREFYNVEGDYCTWSRPGVIVVRECYQAYKWQIRTAVDLLHRYAAILMNYGVGRRARILTDAGGPMFQAIVEVETDSMATWEEQRRVVYQQPEFKVWFVQLLTTVEGGNHDFYRVESMESQK